MPGSTRGSATSLAGVAVGLPRAAAAAARARSPAGEAWRRLRRNRLAMLGAAVLLAMALVALLAPWVAPYPYAKTDLAYGPRAPTPAHPLGTDELGRDLLTRLMWGARVSLGVGLLATLVSLTIGVSYGALAGYLGGRADHWMMRAVDILYGLPFMFFVIILMVLLGRNVFNLFIALGAVQWLTMARIVRGQVLSLKVREFVEGARALGGPPLRVLARHVVPNAAGPVIVYATLTVPAVMLEEAFLSFLGLGVQPPMASWGSLAAEGAAAMEPFPWLILFPGLALTVTLLSLNFLGDGLRDALDPRIVR